MNDFSPWDWADTFLLHEAACLIAGVPVVPKVTIALDELPTYARPVLKQLMIAWAIGERHRKSPDASFPKERMLQSLPSDGTGHCLSTMFARHELHRWVREMGRKSAYSFEQVGALEQVPVVDSCTLGQEECKPLVVNGPAHTAATPAPVVVTDWRNAVRAEAWEKWVQTLAGNGTPTLENVSVYLANWCDHNTILTDTGKTPKSGYIKIHVIDAKHWNPPRNMSREAAKKHLEQKEHAKQAN